MSGSGGGLDRRRCEQSVSELVVFGSCTVTISKRVVRRRAYQPTCEKVVLTTVGVTAAPMPRVVIGMSGMKGLLISSVVV